MADPVLDLDQRLRAPLAAYGGRRPPAPAWFASSMADAPVRSFTQVEGAEIETLVWGERGRPGLLLVHGGMANADWWSAIAPIFAQTHRVAALSLSGMGRSSWREVYTVDQYARELDAVARAAGLHAAGPPTYLAHSFGSRPLTTAAADPALAPGLAIIADMVLSPRRPGDAVTSKARPRRIYPTAEAALTRFRLMPYQACENLYLLDEIARHSMTEVEAADGTKGWAWRFDPYVFEHFGEENWARGEDDLRSVVCPLAFVNGDRSHIVRPDNLAYTRGIAPAGTVFVTLPEAAHHLFLDQPLAFVAAVRALIAERAR